MTAEQHDFVDERPHRPDAFFAPPLPRPSVKARAATIFYTKPISASQSPLTNKQSALLLWFTPSELLISGAGETDLLKKIWIPANSAERLNLS